MNLFSKSILLAVAAAFFFSSCCGDPTASNPEVAKMSDAGKKAMDEASQSLCTCLKDHGAGLKGVSAKVKEVAAEVEKAEGAEDKMAAMGKMMEAMGGMKEFTECMNKAKPSGDAEKAMEDDIKKIVGEDADRKTRNKKTFEIIQVYLDKNCSANAKVFKDFVATMDEMDNLRKMK